MAIESYLLTIDEFCTVRAFIHNAEIPLSIRKIVDVRQVSWLIEEVSNYNNIPLIPLN